MRNILKKVLPIILVLVNILACSVNVFAIERVYILPTTTREKAPKNNMFQLKDSSLKFILLESTDEGYFVLAEKYVAAKPFSKNGEPVPYDPKDENSIAHWLNNDFLTSGYLPDVMVESLVEREYTTEGGGSEVKFSKEYKSTCKVVLLSQTEWSKYNAKFGYADDTSYAYWALRTVRERTGSILMAAVSAPNSGLTVDGKWGSTVGLRAAFFLSKDFFEKASIDVENTGDTVLSLIRKEYEPAVLGQMYNSSEMYALTEEDIAPTADDVSIVGRGIVGEAINGSYSFNSLDGNSEDGTEIKWERSKAKWWWSTIVGANSQDYVPTTSDVGYYVRMKVSPMTGSMAGSTYTSQPLAVKIRAISTPVASNVRIVSDEDVKPGTILDVKYSFSDENRDICSGTEYIWESSADKTTIEKIGSSRYCKLTNAEGGKYVRVGVIPKKQTNSADGRKTVAGSVAYSEWMFVEDLPVASDVSLKLDRNSDLSVTISKTEDNVSITNLVVPNESSDEQRAIASYGNGEGNFVCEWQVASSKNGVYGTASTGTDVFDYDLDSQMWVRTKIYSVKDGNMSKVVYSEPVLMGTDKVLDKNAVETLTQQLTAGKVYEIWILNDNAAASNAFSFVIKGDTVNVSSEKYQVKAIETADGAFAIGTLISDIYNDELCFKAGEITATQNGTVTISDVLTTAVGGSNVCKAKVFVIEK